MTTNATPATSLRIDFVSDISCPWCAIGLSALEQAVARIGQDIQVDLHFQPFELNPQMPAGGQDITEHLTQKYGSTPDQQKQIRDTIRERGADVGFTFRMEGRDRIYNTFDAHRLLHWAEVEGSADQQHALKKALLTAYFTEGQSPESHDVLVATVAKVGLSAERARAILASDEFAADVRSAEQQYLNAGIHSVPAVIIDNKHLISGGQPVEVFEQALRKLSAQSAVSA
jgi:predicted DsbA family dithiol-disulfide isomerase